MHRRYNACCPPQRRGPTPASCCIESAASASAGSNPGAIPESARVIQNQCPEVWLTVTDTPTCTDSGRVKILVPTTPGLPPPAAIVANTPASQTTQNKSVAVLNNASNPYDPATRFAQYFPPQPPGVECPERLPNNLPLPSTRPCIPVTRFHGSDWPPSS